MGDKNRQSGSGRPASNRSHNNTQSIRAIRERKKRKKRRRMLRIILKLAVRAAIIAVIIILIVCIVKHVRKSKNTENTVTVSSEEEVADTQIATTESLSVEAEETLSEDASETEEVTTEYIGELPDIDITSWEYVLVNADNPIGEYAPDVVECEGIEVDSRIADAMTEFIEDTAAQGLPVYPSSGYRDYDTQSYLYNRKISQGYSEEEAATIVAPPGTSEHQTGLAADITDEYRETKNESLEDTETYQWMSAHCQDYGFVVRYPKGKEDITGIIYEPWHFRYVGKEAAKFMMDNNLCLEEFVALYQ